MTEYEIKAFEELNIWKTQMKSKPSLIEKSTKSVQVKMDDDKMIRELRAEAKANKLIF